jgi:hypothetical protein
MNSWEQKVNTLGAIWSGKFPPQRPRIHSLIEKLFSSLAIVICLGSLSNFVPKKISRSQRFMDVYVLIWASVLIIILLCRSVPPFIAQLVVTYRIVDIVSYRIFFLLVKSQEKPWTDDVLRRSLAIAVVNFGEIVIGFAVLYLNCGCVVQTGNVAMPLQGAIAALYYSLVTMTTLGYGDFIPSRPIGRLLVIGQLTTTISFLLFLVPALISVFASRLSRDSSDFSGRP